MNLHNIFLSAHRGFAYLELLLTAIFIISLLSAMFGYSGKISKILRKSTLFTMIFFHIQFLIGAVMLFTYFANGMDMGSVMKDSALRFRFVEHPFSMLISAVLITIINKKLKTNEKLSMGIVILAVITLALFFFAFPFSKLFGS